MKERARANLLSREIVSATIEVHRELGPGLLESAYEECLCHELMLHGVAFARQLAMPIQYKGLALESGYRLDVLVEGVVIVELKSVEALTPIHSAQLLSYLRLSGLWLGMLINFNVPLVKDGIKRLVNG